MKYMIIAGFLALTLYSCKKTTSLPEYNSDPVVTAYLSAGRTITLKLTHQASTSSTVFSSPSLDGLDLIIKCGDSTYHLTDTGGAVYTNAALIIEAGKQYDLSFVYNGKTVTAAAIIPSRPADVTQSATTISVDKIDSTTTGGGFGGPGNMTEPVEITWTNNDASYYVIVVENLETNPERIIDTSANVDTGRVFRNSPVTTGTYDITSRSFKYFGAHRIVLYHIRPDYALLYDNSSSSSQSLSTPANGITNGVGIFTGVNADTLYLQVNKK